VRKAQKAKEGHRIWCDQELIISHDNATFFTGAELPAGEGEVFHVLRVPSKPPDIHQIVAHPIHPVKAMFRKRFTQVKGAGNEAAGGVCQGLCKREWYSSQP
jgi:hypothetical protein